MRGITTASVKKLIVRAHDLDEEAFNLLKEISELTEYSNEAEHEAIILASHGRMAVEHLFEEAEAA